MKRSYSTSQSETLKLCVDKQLYYNMLLAPFQPPTRIELDTNVNISIECCLDIRNNSDKTLNVTVTKKPVVERQISLSSSELEIQGNSNGKLCIKWSPKEAGCWRDVLQLTDSRRIKYDIIIATTAKGDKKNIKTKKSLKSSASLSKLSNHFVSVANKQFQSYNNSLKVPIINRPSVINLNAQVQQYKPKCDKENILNKNNEIKTNTAWEKDNKIDGSHHYKYDKSDNVLTELNMNVWNDESNLSQVFLPSNGPEDIRRATYVKERKPCSNILYECDEEVTEDTARIKHKAQSDFSIMLNKFTFTSMDDISNSPLLMRNELTESMSSQIADSHKTFNISHNQLLERFAAHNTKTSTDVPLISQPAGLHGLSPIKSDGCSLITDIKDLIASSPIAQLQQRDILKDSNEYLKHFVGDINHSFQTTDNEYFSFEVIPKNIETTKETQNLYIEISPPKKQFRSKSVSTMVPNLCGTRTGRITKNKTLYEGKSAQKLQLNIPVTKKNTKKVAAIKISKLSFNALRQTKWYAPSPSRESSFKTQNKEESFIYEGFELDPFAPSTTEDPFLKNTVHYDEYWLLQQELAFTKWLNALLSSPEDLSVDIETAVTDIGKVWQSCKMQKDTILAETKEAVSARYHTNTRLNTLRKAASAMFNRSEVMQVLSRTNMYIVKGTLCIRSDRNLHRDIGLQKLILGLFLSYNPLWLRIGLETVYGECIPLRSNNDIVGLTRFLLARFFSEPRLIKMSGYHKTDPSQKFVTQLNQFILKKFLSLVYFLDYAKQHKLIGHDPCLFHKRAQHKESRDVLLAFSREVLSGIGDVTRVLRGHNYVLTYRQTYIEEYDYAITDIRRDLRDGVRLCRVMELITGARGLTQSCRVPAISRLQKVHNMDMALNALSKAGYVLEGDINTKSIADGHCEKTLSLLWQIIHKYQAPRFNRSARVIQRWWRAQLWYICTRNFLRIRRNLAAIKIQRAWKRKTTQSRHVSKSNCDLEERRWFLRVRTAAIYLQRWWRQRSMEKLQDLKNRRRVVIMLQRKWRATLLMRTQRIQYCNLRNAILTIQIRWRATQAMKLQRSKYLAHKDAAVIIQSWWRSMKVTWNQRECFLRSRKSAHIIQAWWRRYLLMRKTRNDFLLAKIAVQSIERWWINVLDRKKFLLFRKSAILIQRTWKKYRKRKQEIACLKMQTWWRTILCLHKYKLQKSSCIKLQRWWRGVVLMDFERTEFLQLRDAALVVQKNWRMKTIRRCYLKKQRAVLLIQSWYHRVNSTRIIRRRYLEIRSTTIQIQNWWRNIALARQERRSYLRLYKSVIFLQTHWRQRTLARADYQRYLMKRKACIILQSWWRMNKKKNEYKQYKACVLMVQRRWHAMKAIRTARREYLLKQATIIVQARWRALKTRKRFIALRQAALVIQSYYRMRIAMQRYKTTKYAALIIQTYWRAYIVGKRERLRYLSLRRAVITLQCHYKRKRAECKELCQEEEVVSIVTKIRDECGKNIQMAQDTMKLALLDNDHWEEKISILRNCDNVGRLLTCLNSLDIITKLSPTVCITLCELKLADDIYNTIARNNRSLPWMKVCILACDILITLAKYSYTRKYIVRKEYALALIKVLSGSLKDKEVFLHCATLIWLLSQDEDYSKAMVACPQISWLIKNIEQKILKTTMTKFQKSKDLEKLYPSCEPDRYNMQKPRLFTDMSCAIAAILKRTCT